MFQVYTCATRMSPKGCVIHSAAEKDLPCSINLHEIKHHQTIQNEVQDVKQGGGATIVGIISNCDVSTVGIHTHVCK